MKTVSRAITADKLSGAKVTDTPLNRSVTGYGPKIPTRYMVQVGKRWHRVYMMQYGNSGSAYVIIGGQDHFITGSVEYVLEEVAKGRTFEAAYADLVGSLTLTLEAENEALQESEGAATD